MTEPPRKLKELGFWALCALELQRHWPDTSLTVTQRWMREFIGVPFGTIGYDWSREAAADAAHACAVEFSEEADR